MYPSVDNPDISIIVFGLCSDSRMFSGIGLSLICNKLVQAHVYPRSQQAVWEQKNIRPGNETCSGTCSTLFSHDHVLCHCTLCQLRSGHYLCGNNGLSTMEHNGLLYPAYILNTAVYILTINSQSYHVCV